MRTLALIVLLCGPLAACAGGSPAGDGDAGPRRCDFDTDCSDGVECTVDTCGVGNVCEFTPLTERCAAGETCVAGRGCVAGTTCMSTADCDDSIDCTLDSCGVGGTCRHMPLSERCTDTAAPMCDPAMGCVAGTGCRGDADCDDEIACTIDTCGVDMMCDHEAINERCDTAAGEVCSVSMGCYVPMDCTTADECQDDDFCNGAEECMPEFGCAAAPAPRTCDDSEPCTHDSCDPAAGMGGACVFQCDPTLGSECMAMCPPSGPTCTGTFMLSPAITDNCASGMVNYDMSRVTFEIIAGTLTATPTRAHFGSLADTTEPVCPSFVATATVSGGTPETFTLMGTFTDDDTFMGSFTADYGGFGIIAGCREGTMSVTGTRMP